jgi:hypothetical protein
MLTFLWDDCPRCFWLKARHAQGRPWMPMPSVFNKYHTVLQNYFIGRSPSEMTDALPGGRCLSVESWVKSEPLRLHAAPADCYILGRIDHLVRFDDGGWGVIDYKTTIHSEVNVEKYARQLHAYAWALERAAPGALQRTPVTRLGLFCLEPQAMLDFDPGAQATVALRPKWIEVERDDTAFERFLAEAVQRATRPDPPAADDDCSVCTYADARADLEAQFVSDDLPF